MWMRLDVWVGSIRERSVVGEATFDTFAFTICIANFTNFARSSYSSQVCGGEWRLLYYVAYPTRTPLVFDDS